MNPYRKLIKKTHSKRKLKTLRRLSAFHNLKRFVIFKPKEKEVATQVKQKRKSLFHNLFIHGKKLLDSRRNKEKRRTP